MKTLLLSEIFPPKTGGSGRWFWEIYRRMPCNQFHIATSTDVEAAAFDPTHDLSLERGPLTLGDWGITTPSALRAYAKAFSFVRKIVRREKIERIHCGRLLPEGWIAMWLKKLYGIPFVCYVHGEDANPDTTGESDGVLFSRQLRLMTKAVVKNAECIIANSRNSARIMTEHWNMIPERVHLLHPGVDTNYFEPAARNAEVRKQLGWNDRPVIITAGRLQKRKGQDTMIRALGDIRAAVPDVLYAIAGDGEEREPLKQLVQELGHQDHVQFMGRVDDDVLRQAYQQADLFVLANRQIGTDIEGFGMVLLEAQACGTPVVAGTSGGTPETMRIGETGQVVNCDGPDELSVTLAKMLLDRSALAEMGVAARKWVEKKFEWNALSYQAADIFGVSHADVVTVSSAPLEVADVGNLSGRIKQPQKSTV
jgi:phosphatidyl-myo-inositol dimannoside synthase